MAEQTKFSVLCSLFTWMQRSKSSAKKRSKFRKFLDTFCKPNDYFSAIRLILPNLDRERGTYGLKESSLSNCLIDALGMSKESEDANRLINWRKGGPKTGAFAGNYALVAAEVLQRRQGATSGGLTIKELNEQLDKLASSESRAEKTSVLGTLIQRTNAQEMKWIVMIILKDLKLGISEKSIFHEFHPDAEDLFNVTCDLKLLCEKLRDRNQRHKRQDIEVGKAVRPQLAMRVSDASAAWKKLHGKEVVVECKFDGDRIQIHKNGNEIHFFSRNFLDHSEYEHGISDLIIQNVIPDRCILDGEMLVWDTSLNRFAEFGSNQEIAKAAKDGLDSDRQLCYVAFDILYVGDTSVIHQSLNERHELLRKVVKPFKGRLEILVPNTGLNTRRTPGEPCWSHIAHSMDDIERFFKETIENRDEGIVIKDLGSKWEPGDRSGKWLKLKPEYIRAGSDLDCLIIGGYYGSGRRGGEVAQFLVGLAERPDTNTYPRRFISFCRVGTGLSDDELDALVRKLKPYFRKYDYSKKAPPSYYQVTNNSKERPDVWVDSPEKSVILSINSDIRTISSEVFAAPYSLRFPRIERVRYDKPWYECLDVQSFLELVQSSNGTTQRGTEYAGPQDNKGNRVKSSRGKDKRNMSVLPSHLVQTDISDVKGNSQIFSDMVFYFVNVPPTCSIDSLCKIVAENGGTFSMNLNKSVTHCVAADSKGFKFEAAKRHGDIIHYSWVMECSSQKKLVTLQPKYFLHLSEPTKKKLQEEVDEFSDSYYCDMHLPDLKQLLNNIPLSDDVPAIDHYRKKYCPKNKWCQFHDYCICFHILGESVKYEWRILSKFVVRRLKLEVIMGGGKITESLTHATHLVILSAPKNIVNFENVLRSFTSEEKKFLRSKKVHVVQSQWLEDCLAEDERLPEERYSLKPISREESNTEQENDSGLEVSSGIENLGNEKISRTSNVVADQSVIACANQDPKLSSPRGTKRSRGRPAARGFKRQKSLANQARRTRAHISRKPAKIFECETDESGSHDEITSYEEVVNEAGNPAKCPELQEMEKKLDSELLDKNKVDAQDPMDVELGKHQVAEVEMTNRHDINSEKPGQMGGIDDPIQAMLFNMIPSLGKTTADGKENRCSGGEADMIPSFGKTKVEVEENHSSEAEVLPTEPTLMVAKKKKVSYKDVAGELLKDW